MNKKRRIILIVLLPIVIPFLSIAFYSFYSLWQFKQCYDNSFELPYCEKYKTY